ncbi:cytochrome P450 [Mucidula mucida]|nr:cytochrome P450 [Mucidula mucida]
MSGYATIPLSICILLLIYIAYCAASAKKAQYPPGPRGLPIIGNALQIPSDRQWLKWDEWRREYGNIMQINVLGQPTVILSSLKCAKDLLETRGNIYSDRPSAVMAGELVGWNRGLGYANASGNPRFREFRRSFHHFMGPKACESQQMREVQERENLRLLGKLMHDPDNFATHVRECTSSTILVMAYGYPADKGDPLQLVKIAEDAMHGFAVASEPGRWWVDSFPLLKYIPAWFPGASFRQHAKAMREDLDRLCDIPFNFVLRMMSKGTFQPSFLSSYLEENKNATSPVPGYEELAKAAGASLYSGGAETTPSALNSFILAMTLYPEIQAKAQAEIDSICSGGLPCIADRDRLPYVSALVKEVWRWNPSVPLGLPHVASQDDEYMGYTIKKGSVIWANIWSMMHDEDIFPDPSVFNPERYLLGVGGLDASEAVESAFGFGRRICPGMYLAENSVFLTVATILATFDIRRVVDPVTRVEVLPEVEYDGFISHPRPFKCNITPRSEHTRDLVYDLLETLEATDSQVPY